MKADKYRFDGARTCDLRALSCDDKDALEHTSHNYPILSTEAQQNLQDCRTRLEAENS